MQNEAFRFLMYRVPLAETLYMLDMLRDQPSLNEMDRRDDQREAIMKKNILLIVVILIAVTGCDYLPFGYTDIKDIVQKPANYEGKEIKVKGTVSNVFKIPFVEIKLYTVKDAGGELTVITDGPLPGMNQDIKIRAVVDSTAIIGGESIGLKLKEIKRF